MDNPMQRVTGRLLDGRTAIISGAGRARGIGKATARLFLQHGARVVLLDLDEAEVHQAAADVADFDDGSGIAPNCIGIRCDVTRSEDCQAAIAQALQWAPARGRIDVLVNNAGITQKRGVMDITTDDFTLVSDVVLRGTVQLSQAVIPTMRAQRSGSLVAVSSMSAQQGGGIFGGPHYCAAKAGVLGFTRALARELGADNIRANAITPGLTLTDFSRSGSTDEAKHATAKPWPLARAAHPNEMASACLFLASDLASYVTGITLDVNGGAYMR